MKTISIFLLLLSFSSGAQIKLEPQDLTNLVAISELYSKVYVSNGANFAESIDSLRTPQLNHLIDVLMKCSKRDTSLFSTQLLLRPTYDEMILWYVIREIHYNISHPYQGSESNKEVAKKILSQQVDERWLLDNYYYRVMSGLGFLFNSADLSGININTKKLGLKNETERAIFYLNLMSALVGGRLMVLKHLGKNQQILDLCDKLPSIDAKKYFYYQNFDYEDFDWIGFEKIESYNKRHIGGLYTTLWLNFTMVFELRSRRESEEIYLNSILSALKYFKYSSTEDILKNLYESSKQLRKEHTRKKE